MKTLCDHAQCLACKLRMIDISCEGSTCLHGDNKSVLANTTMPESMLNKNSSSSSYYLMRKEVAMDDQRTACIKTYDNEADLLTKVLPFGDKMCRFSGRC